MANGYMIKLDVPITGDNPKLYKDPIMSEGSIFLLDESRTETTTYVNGTGMKNIAGSIAAPIIGVSESALDPVFFKSATLLDSEMIIEKTEKGALHMQSTAGTYTSGRNMRIPIPADIIAYMLTRIAAGDDFYCSFWYEYTRAATNDQRINTIGTSAFSANYLYVYRTQSSGLPSVDRYENVAQPQPAGQPIISTRFIQQVFGTVATGTVNSPGIYLGSFSGGVAGNPSFIVRKFYIENLTLSGRAYADVRDLDIALHTEALAVGGRFYGDTWNSPIA